MKFRYIGQPLFIRSFCRKFTIQDIFGYVLWICSLSCTAIVCIFDGGFDTKFPADAQNTFIIYINVMVTLQLITDSAITLIR